MPHTIAIFPKFNGLHKIELIRKKYDPSCEWLKPHITLVYYFKEKPTKEKINELIKEFSSFDIKLGKISASSKHNLIFLDVTEGYEKIVKLKNKLYKTIGLKWDKEFSYKPHITIANLKTKQEQRIVLKEIKNEHLNFSCEINSFLLLDVSDQLNEIKSKRNFKLC